MNLQQINSLLVKINDLKALFVSGQRVLPFLEELFNFVQDIVPLLDEINTSISESTSKIPHASTHLKKVTHATELAATEIFNTVDSILLTLGDMKREQLLHAGQINKVMQIDDEISLMLRKELAGQNDTLLVKIDLLLVEKRQKHRSILELYEQMGRRLDEVHDSASNIMMSMQVQDITVQQIAAVNHLITSVERKLGLLIRRLKEDDTEIDFRRGDDAQAFDPDAAYDTSGQRQSIADALFEKHASEKHPDTPATQEEIDRIFQKLQGDSGDAMDIEK